MKEIVKTTATSLLGNESVTNNVAALFKSVVDATRNVTNQQVVAFVSFFVVVGGCYVTHEVCELRKTSYHNVPERETLSPAA